MRHLFESLVRNLPKNKHHLKRPWRLDKELKEEDLELNPRIDNEIMVAVH